MKNTRFRIGLTLTIIILLIGAGIVPSMGGTSIKKQSLSETKTSFSGLNPSGNILYVGGSNPGNYSKIQDAIDNASDGDTVFVFDDSSPYYESIVVDKSISLIGEDRDTTILDGGGSGDVVNITANGVNITTLTIRSPGSDFEYSFLKLYLVQNCTIFNNKIYSASGILLYSSDSNLIKKNGVNSDFEGIYLHNSKNNIITFNTFINGGDGINLYVSNNNIVTNNNVSNCWAGIRLYASSDNKLYENNLHNNGKGFYLYYAQRNVFMGNEISECTLGFDVESMSSINNIIFHNNFINNIDQAWDGNINNWYNITVQEGNYWDDYNGTDGDGDGIGDTPYIIPGGDNQDLYPLMFPYGWVNQPPNIPVIDGPNSGKAGTSYPYTFTSIDLEDNDVSYYIRWGDGDITSWTDFQGSGAPGYTESHSWDTQGTYIIQAKAKDINGYESEWKIFTVIMPRNRAYINSPFLQNHPHIFPILRYILGL